MIRIAAFKLAQAARFMTCGDRCPRCGLGCNKGIMHGGKHTDREHSW